jgi:hypothetical protein
LRLRERSILPFGHAFHFETDTGRQGIFTSQPNDWNVKFDRAALVAEPLYHTPDADGLKITSTSTLTGSVHTTVISTNDHITKNMSMFGKRLLKSMTMKLCRAKAGKITLGRSRISI